MNKYEGLNCPVCHDKLFENGEPVVVCPICGAPHHKKCYNIESHCSFVDTHNTPEQWQKPEPEAEEHIHNSFVANCKTCGHPLLSDSQFCNKCGAKVYANSEPPIGGAPQPPNIFPSIGIMDPLGGVHSDELIEGVPAKEVASCVLINTARYVPRFKFMALNGSKKISWNFAAFFFAPYWLFYRKCYKEGMFALLTFAAYTALSIPFKLYQATNISIVQAGTSFDSYYKLITEIIKDNQIWRLELIAVSLLIQLCLSVFLGLFGDYIYKKNTISKIKEYKSQPRVDDLLYNLQRIGGVNFVIPVIIFSLEFLLNSLL